MYIFSTTKTIESKLFPGVKITLRKMTEARRSAYQLATAEFTAKVRELLSRIAALKPDGSTVPSDAAVPEILKLQSEMNQVVTQELNPAKLKWAVKGISGLMLETGDEQTPATVDGLMDWPSDLTGEVLNWIEQGTVLNEFSAKNSEPPTTAGKVEPAGASTSSAENASDSDSSSEEIAKSSFLN